MTTYVDVALEEIRKDYPKAYEILKGAVIPEYVPYHQETCINYYTGGMIVSKLPNNPQLIVNCPDVEDVISTTGMFVTGSLTLGLDTYKINNMIKSKYSTKHQVIFELEHITKE